MSEKQNMEEKVKLVVVGDSGVGKSSLTGSFAGLKFNSKSISTIGIDFKLKIVVKDGKKYKIHIWDTAGQERYKTITNNYYRLSDGIIFVYSVTDKNSFLNVQNWINDANLRINLNDVQKILIGTKCDDVQNRIISYEDGEYFAKCHRIRFFETSAKTNQNVEEAIMSLVFMVIQERSKLKNSGEIKQIKTENIIYQKPRSTHKSFC